MIKIHYELGGINISTTNKNFRITNLEQIHLVQDQFKCYRNKCETKQKFCMYTAILDALMAAKQQFLRYNEIKCLKKWL